MKKYPDSFQKQGNQPLVIAGEEISAVLDIDESYAIAREKFLVLKNYCTKTLRITSSSPYQEILDHYLLNSGSYIMCPNFKKVTDEEIEAYKKNYITFLSIIARIAQLQDKQKLSFLKQLKKHFTAPQHIQDTTESPIKVMDDILSSLH